MAKLIYLLFAATVALTLASSINANSLFTNQTEEIADEKENKVFTCSSDEECNGHGKCVNSTVCVCNPGWTTLIAGNEDHKFCLYQQRPKTKTFLLSFFFGSFGVDWFYLSRKTLTYISIGLVKLLFGSLALVIQVVNYKGKFFQNAQEVDPRRQAIGAIFCLISISWWIVDWARILTNRFPDGNRMPLFALW